ncbi:MAG: cell cycle transcriptional regulator TrcR [Pseudomonadota bacterium]
MPTDDTPLMPKATAVWLVDNTSLSFDQIAAFCRLHPLEVGAIADGDAAQGIKGSDPIQTGQLTREEIAKGEADTSYRLKLSKPKTIVPTLKRKSPRYTPVSKRQDRPNAILWLLRHHPEMKEAAIIRLVGTTKATIHAIRDRTHWNSANLQPLDPVTLGLCSQMDLDREVDVAAKEAGITDRPVVPLEQPDVLMPVEESLQPLPDAPQPEPRTSSGDKFDPDAVFAGLKAWTKSKERSHGDDDV